MRSALRSLLLILVLALPAAAQQPDTLRHAIPAPPTGVQSGAQLGSSVAVDGGYAVVGAPFDKAGNWNAGNSGAGVVKVFDSSTGALLLVLLSPSQGAINSFGAAVAISGTRVVVGAPYDDPGASDAGSAYVYDLSSPTPTVPILTLNKPSPVASDWFGRAVAISGSRVVVGVPGDDTAATYAGSAYVYDVSSATPAVPVATLINPEPAAVYSFGRAVGISDTRVVVRTSGGGGGTARGSAYVYDLSSATPTLPVATLTSPNPIQGEFDLSVAISGTRVVVGDYQDDTGAGDAGSAYVYDLNSGTPTIPVFTLNNPAPGVSDRFGWSVAISGVRVVVGVYWDDAGASDSGSAYVYDLSSETPTVPVETLNNPSPAVNAYFGYSVAISGTRVVVGAIYESTGASGAGSAYVYDMAGATPAVPVATLHNPSPAVNDNFGNAVAISGTLVVVGAWRDYTGIIRAGRAFVYNLAGALPTVPVFTLNNPGPASDDFFGASVAISGMRVVVGATGDDTSGPVMDAGIAYVYDLAGPTPTTPVATLANPNPGPAASDVFGQSVGISGTRVVVGAWGDDTSANDAGIAYVYDLAGATPTVPAITLINPDPAETDYFGRSVGISGTRVVVGAIFDDMGAIDAPGSAYIYDLAGATPTVPVSTLNNPSPNPADQFGIVAIDGTTVAIGAPGDDTTMVDKGTAYVFAPANPDYDGDGLLDLWEEARFGSITAHTAEDDADGDGRVELLEQAFDTNPLGFDAAAVLPQVVNEGGFLTMTISKRAGVSYTVETAGSPSGVDFSMGTTTMITNDASTLKVRDNFTPATATQRFMRVKVSPQP